VSGASVVLVVDADPAARRAAAAALPPEHYRLVYAGGAEAALPLLESEPVAVLVAEIVLPGTSGLSMLAAARHSHPHVARVVLTAAAELESVLTAVNEAEVLRFLRKPIEPAGLRAAVDDALAWAEASREVARARAAAERRRVELDALATDHPGMLPAAAAPDGYAIPPHRVAALAERLADTPLGPLLSARRPREAE
jgi:DNA-binding NtrC family response regulator